MRAAACRNQGWRQWKGVDGTARGEGGRGWGNGGGRCPKGVFRNRGKMEENRYSLVAGKSRVERAERGRRGAQRLQGLKEGDSCALTGVHMHAHTVTHDPRSRFKQDDPGKTPKIRRYETRNPRLCSAVLPSSTTIPPPATAFFEPRYCENLISVVPYCSLQYSTYSAISLSSSYFSVFLFVAVCFFFSEEEKKFPSIRQY